MDISGDLTLQWVEEVGNVTHEEVICDLDSDLVTQDGEVIGACEEVCIEETVQTVPHTESNLQNDTEILMVPQVNDMESIYIVPQDQGHDYLNIQVTEEVITDNWDRTGPDDGVAIPVTKVSHDNLLEYDDMEIPLPIDQDSYTNTRPYPCDFCSRRFRKKANLMNHMVAHQTDRPHGCNLCGARYIRKCDLMNHLKIHAYAPCRDDDELDDFDDGNLAQDMLDGDDIELKSGRRKKNQTPSVRKRRAANKRNLTTTINSNVDDLAKIIDTDKYFGKSSSSSSTTVATASYNYSNYNNVDDNNTNSNIDINNINMNVNDNVNDVDNEMNMLDENITTHDANTKNVVFASSSRWTDNIISSDCQTPRWPITDPTKPYVCQYCGVCFAREKALASHARIHGGDSPFECTNCGDLFWDVNSLREHVKVKHGITTMDGNDYDNQSNNYNNGNSSNIGGIDDDDDDDDDPTDNNKFGEYYCETCGVPFHRMDLLKRHRKIHVKQEQFDQFQDQTDILENTVDGSQHHVCNVCGEWFEEALALLAHAELHLRSPTQRCLLCGERCRDDTELAEHVRQNHADDAPPNTCPLCGKTCKDKRSLLKHSWVHNADKTFSCTKCGKRFHSKARLRRHMVSHRNKMVACDECGEEFPDGRALVSHRHSHNKELGGRTFPCRECGKTFGSRSSQQIHIRIHTGERPYGCRFCWKAFADGGTLRKHERIHTGEKPYGCAICPRAFNQRVVLREHVRAHHSGPDPKCHGSMTPYLCKVCGSSFATSEEIALHIVQHCDENTALRRQPQIGPRKYKRRRKLKPHESPTLPVLLPHNNDDNLNFIQPNSDSDNNHHQNDNDNYNYSNDNINNEDTKVNIKRKVGRKSKQYRANNIDDDYQNVLKNFETSLQNINSLVTNTKSVNNVKSKLSKKKIKKEDKKNHSESKQLQGDIGNTGGGNNNSSVSGGSSGGQPGRPKMIHTQKTRVPVEVGSEGVKRGQKTKTMVTRTPKVIPNEHKLNIFPGGERNRPRTKNVNYHIENKLQLPPARFPKSNKTNYENDSTNSNTIPTFTAVNIKQEAYIATTNSKKSSLTSPSSSSTSFNNYENNNGNIENVNTKTPTTTKRKATVKGKSKKRGVKQVIIKQEPRDEQINDHENDLNADMNTNDNHSYRLCRSKYRKNNINNNINNINMNNPIDEQMSSNMLDQHDELDANNMEVAYEANVITNQDDDDDLDNHDQETIIPDIVNIPQSSNKKVRLSVKVESTANHILRNVEEEISETIIPDTIEYTCEMCSAVFSTRAELLIHVPIHI